MLRMHRDEIYIWTIIDIRSLPKGRSPVYFNIITLSTNITTCIKSRAAWMYNMCTMPALPFVRSMGPNTRNVFDATSHQTQGDLAMPHL